MANIIYCTGYIVLFSFIILKSAFFKLPQFKNIHALFAFYLKLAFGVVLWYIYVYHYKNRLTSDIFKYYDDGKVMYSALHHHFSDFVKLIFGLDDSNSAIKSYYMQMNSWNNSYNSTLYNNDHFIIRLNALLLILSGDHYGVHIIFMCFVSLLGLVYIYKAFYPYLPDLPNGLFAAVFLFPSILLWGSGVLKEGLILLGLGLSLYYFEAFVNERGNKTKNSLLFLLGLLLLIENKAYVMVCILPCFIAEYLCRKTICGKHPFVTYITITIIYLGIGLNLGLLNSRLNPIKMISTKQQEFNRLMGGGIFLVKEGDTSIISYHYVYLPYGDTLDILPASTYSDSLLRNAGLYYLASGAFYNKEKISKRFAYLKIKKGLPFIQVYQPDKDTVQGIGDDSTRYWLDMLSAPAQSRINIKPIPPTLTGLIAGIPSALAISLLRPFPEEIHNAAMFIYSLENLSILLLIVLTLIFMKKGK